VVPLQPEPAIELFCSIAHDAGRDDPLLPQLLKDLEGLPLAIKLMAQIARGSSLSLTWRQWQQKRGALSGMSPLGAAVQLSWTGPRMTEAARRLLSMLALLSAGIAQNDLEALLPDEGIEAAGVVSKSGLAFLEGTRLRILAPLREQIAASWPPLSGDADRVWGFYLALARKEGRIVGTRVGDIAIARLTDEIANIEKAMGTSFSGTRSIEAVDAAIAMTDFVRFSGYTSYPSLEQARSAARAQADSLREAGCIFRLGEIALANSRVDEASKCFEQALPLYRMVGDVIGQANCIKGFGDIALRHSNREEASKCYEQALVLYRAVGNIVGKANCIKSLGGIALDYSRYEEARQSFEQALLLYRGIGEILGEANCTFSLGEVALASSRYEEARQSFEQALFLYRRIPELYSIGWTYQKLAKIALSSEERRLYVAAAREAWLSINRPDLVAALQAEFGDDF
jgi:tetratricopeptide (TPR) repeat protein